MWYQSSHTVMNQYIQQILPAPYQPLFEPCARYLFNAKATQSLHQRNLKKKSPTVGKPQKSLQVDSFSSSSPREATTNLCQVSLQFDLHNSLQKPSSHHDPSHGHVGRGLAVVCETSANGFLRQPFLSGGP